MKTCLECYNIFDRSSDLITGSYCPILNCMGEVIDIDDSILHAIHLMNKKGYKTDFCCSGHTWGDDPYICFSNSVSISCFTSIPENFSSEISDEGKFILRCTISTQDPVDRQKVLMKASVDLIEWSDKLTPATLLEADFDMKKGMNEMEFIHKVEKELPLKFVVPVFDTARNKTVLHFDIFTAPSQMDEFSKSIKSFAAKNKVKVSIKTY